MAEPVEVRPPLPEIPDTTSSCGVERIQACDAEAAEGEAVAIAVAEALASVANAEASAANAESAAEASACAAETQRHSTGEQIFLTNNTWAANPIHLFLV